MASLARLRAFASLLCTAAPKKTIVLCLWNMERASSCLIDLFVDALKLAYAEQPNVTADTGCCLMLCTTGNTEGRTTTGSKSFEQKVSPRNKCKQASVLAAVVDDDPCRRQQVEYCAANHPHSLNILDRVCIEVATAKLWDLIDVDPMPDAGLNRAT
ncbi:hypothetical protein SELMODRAFT_418836 [Selaginella moellendorffii]|uniref:Uncharacterized protein n=1 Tax=Selaginella moellendorffii TaxID=88036 RepID=D8S6J1_SELML|nr:hypothetical protein SELMODRAFT_418836 [Selaginella moellendorffii]